MIAIPIETLLTLFELVLFSFLPKTVKFSHPSFPYGNQQAMPFTVFGRHEAPRKVSIERRRREKDMLLGAKTAWHGADQKTGPRPRTQRWQRYG